MIQVRDRVAIEYITQWIFQCVQSEYNAVFQSDL